MIKRILVDGDLIVYRAAFSCQTTENGIRELLTDEEGATIRTKFIVNSIVKTLARNLEIGSPYVKIYLSATNDDTLFRRQIAKTKPYKGNRKQPKPYYYDVARAALLNCKYACEVVAGIEADDALAIEQTMYDRVIMDHRDTESVIVSIDKDLLQVPGNHYNFVTNHFIDVSPEAGWRNFCKQVLMGDAVDNIPGLKGIGPKKADKILDEYEHTSDADLFDCVFRAYKEHNALDRLEEVCNLVWLQRDEDFMFTDYLDHTNMIEHLRAHYEV